MGTVELDLEGLLTRLHQREHHSVPFEVEPVNRQGDLAALLTRVNGAADRAYERSLQRHPSDPTTVYGVPSIAEKSIVAMIADGPMSDEEVTAWFTDFGAALDGHRVRVVPQVVVNRVPWRRFDDWALGPDRVLTAFFFFTSDHWTAANGRRFKRRDHALVELTAQDLVTLVQIPAGTPVVDRGGAEFITTPGRQAEELRAHPADFLGVGQFTLKPRRYAAFKFGLRNDAWLQSFDETSTTHGTLDRLCAGLRMLGPMTDYVFVRKDRLVTPDPRLYAGTLRREPTEAESRFSGFAAEEYIAAPSVAQVLNPRHLAKQPDLSSFTVETLSNGRILVVARDLSPWLEGENPTPKVLLAAEEAWGGLLPSASDLDACQ